MNTALTGAAAELLTTDAAPSNIPGFSVLVNNNGDIPEAESPIILPLVGIPPNTSPLNSQDDAVALYQAAIGRSIRSAARVTAADVVGIHDVMKLDNSRPSGGGPQIRCPDCSTRKKTADIRRSMAKMPKERLNGYLRKARDNFHFSGNRQKALERDGFKCQRCGTSDDLAVHHMDGSGTGRGGDRRARNDALDNLQTFCRTCHSIVHHEITRAARSAQTR